MQVKNILSIGLFVLIGTIPSLGTAQDFTLQDFYSNNAALDKKVNDVYNNLL